MCPVAARMYERELICFEPCMWDADTVSVDLLVEAVQKVYAHRKELAELD